MTDQQQHPITPPQELKQQWREQAPRHLIQGREHWLIDRAAQWGYDQRGDVNDATLQQARDQELEACCEEMKSLPSPLGIPFGEMASNALRTARRPKPPSLAKTAMYELDEAVMRGDCITTTDAMPHLRAALKRLAELEDSND